MADLEAMAQRMVAQLREDGAEAGSFAELQDLFDANIGWGEDIDALGVEQWAALQARVDELLRGD